ncbi:ABC transporter ATP-binding protein [Agromyces rhizosphaerae]|uniref:ABC transporter ATP-binding protein n=1 Tax=Agromyces rhizosphaerae TaxID=88374 RepID=A0A9W6CTY5_9MICO|nr:ABC transporter ATP-binding protein [Agromyces rhizosphaerae]GLI26016.1 ABC transporter ATP-binding protein [Agromyces rhizosphaerae]
MTATIATERLSRRFGDVRAVDDVSITVAEHGIVGLLGRNGAGKTTLMQLLTGQDFPTGGAASVFGERPLENARVLSRVCFVKESQRYPDEFKGRHVLKAARLCFPDWDAAFADELVEEFRVPLDRPIKKMSRGQQSAVGVIVGLASRAPLTFFDEPYLGLDAVARQLFYDRLLADYAEHPRTIVLSTHLIDEVANLLEHVIVIDDGRIVIDEPAETLRERGATVVGPAARVEEFVAGHEVLHREHLGGTLGATIAGTVSPEERAAAHAAGLELAPVSLQQLVVRTTGGTDRGTETDA